eukprot:7385025-Prymnesium_polylepis.4
MIARFAVRRALRSHTRSRQKAAQTRAGRHSPRRQRTDPRIQSTSNPPNWRIIACMKVLPPGMTSDAKTSWPTNDASSRGAQLSSGSSKPGLRASHSSSIASVRL